MEIRNFCFGLKNKQIKYYLSQLPDIYRTCEIPILFINRNPFGYLIFLFYNWKYNLGDRSYNEFLKIGGTSYCSFVDSTPYFIYCSLGKYENSKPFLCFTLFHELRHWYQQKYLTKFWKTKYYLNLNLEDDNYEKLLLKLMLINLQRNMLKKSELDL